MAPPEIQLVSSPNPLKGSCECGKIKYETLLVPTSMTACHCLECRKAFNEPYAPFISLPSESMTWSKKPDLITTSSIAERGDCSSCGTPMIMQYHLQPQRVSINVKTANWEGREIPKLTEHIFLREKEEGFEIPDDGAARWDGFDELFEKKLQQWKKERGISE